MNNFEIRKFNSDEWDIKMPDFRDGFYVVDAGRKEILAHYRERKRAEGCIDALVETDTHMEAETDSIGDWV